MKIKYHRVNGNPTKVLVTKQIGTTVYFGISKCDQRDKFVKRQGVRLAETRCNEAVKSDAQGNPNRSPSISYVMFAHDTGLFGYTHQSQVQYVLEHFENC